MRSALLSSSLAVLGLALAGVYLGCGVDEGPCGIGGNCRSCQSDAECEQGKVCASVTVDNGGNVACVSLTGSACTFELDCASGFCSNGTCAPSPFGGRCATDAQCETQSCSGGACTVRACTQPSDCPTGLVCVPVFTDTLMLEAGAVPARGCLLPAGASCSPLNGGSSCAAGISGSQSDISCSGVGSSTPPICFGNRCACSEPGRPCATDTDCCTGTCDPTSSTCSQSCPPM